MAGDFVANGPGDLPTREARAELSGIDFMQAMLGGHLPEPAMARQLNFRLNAVAPGRVAFRGTPEFAVTNPAGAVHGGWYGTLLDSAMGCAVMTMMPAGRTYTTLEYKVNITRGLAIGTEIEAVGEIEHAGRSTAVAVGRILGIADRRLYATASTTCLVMAL